MNLTYLTKKASSAAKLFSMLRISTCSFQLQRLSTSQNCFTTTTLTIPRNWAVPFATGKMIMRSETLTTLQRGLKPRHLVLLVIYMPLLRIMQSNALKAKKIDVVQRTRLYRYEIYVQKSNLYQNYNLAKGVHKKKKQPKYVFGR